MCQPSICNVECNSIYYANVCFQPGCIEVQRVLLHSCSEKCDADRSTCDKYILNILHPVKCVCKCSNQADRKVTYWVTCSTFSSYRPSTAPPNLPHSRRKQRHFKISAKKNNQDSDSNISIAKVTNKSPQWISVSSERLFLSRAVWVRVSAPRRRCTLPCDTKSVCCAALFSPVNYSFPRASPSSFSFLKFKLTF